MKGNISLKQFIHEVKAELIEAQDTSGDPFYTLQDVTLEVSFALEAKGGGKAKFVVLELGAETAASQLHRVTLKFTPCEGKHYSYA
jgi:Trypsin-co-occurring domain 2